MPTTLHIGNEVLDPDVVISEQATSPAVVTAHPIESGSSVVDHVQEQPGSISLEFVITETPLRIPEFGAENVTVSGGPVFILSGSLVDRARQLVIRLRATRTRGELLTLESARLGTVENLALQQVSEVYSSVRAARVSVTLIPVIVADARTVEIPPTLQPRGKRKRERGKQPAAEQTPQRSRSLAVTLFDAL